MSASGVFWRLVQGIADVDPVLLPQAATRAVQRAGAGPVSADEAHGEDDLALAEVHMPESQAFVDSELAAFEARIGQRQPQQQPQQQPPAQRAATSAVAAGLEWSSQALEYMTLLQQDKRCLRHPEYWQRGFQADFFKHVSLVRQGIRDMDAGLLELRGLRELNLSMNSVRVLEHVPRDLCVLHVYGNEMQAVAHGTRCPSLVHLGAGCNRLADAAALCSRFPALVSLDLSYNSLCDLLGTLASLSRLPALRQLWLAGNPLSLLPAYRERVVRSLPQLEHLDDVALRDEDGQAAIPAPLAPHRERDGGYDSLCSVVVHVDSVRNAPPPAAEEPVQAPAEAAPPVPVGRKSASKRGGRAVDSTPEPSAAHAIAAERAVRYYVQLEVPRAAGDAPRSAEVPYAATMEFGWASRHEMPADVRTRDLLLLDSLSLALFKLTPAVPPPAAAEAAAPAAAAPDPAGGKRTPLNNRKASGKQRPPSGLAAAPPAPAPAAPPAAEADAALPPAVECVGRTRVPLESLLKPKPSRQVQRCTLTLAAGVVGAPAGDTTVTVRLALNPPPAVP